MDGQRFLLPRTHTPDDLPPRPSAPGARKPTIRERVDRELRGALVAGVANLPRRPSDGFHDLARAATRPAGKLPDRLIEAAESGASRERVMGELCAAIVRAVNIAFDGVEEVKKAA